MALAEVKRVQIVAHSHLKMELLSSLQESALVQLEEANFEDFDLASSLPEASEHEHLLHRLKQALDYFSRQEEKSFLKRIFAQKPSLHCQKRREVLDFDFRSVLDELEKLEADKNELLGEIKFLEREGNFLSPLKELSLPVSSVEPTDSTEIVLGSIPLPQFGELQKLAEEEAIWFEVIHQDKRKIHLLVFYLKKEKSQLEQNLKDLNFTRG